MYSPSIHHTDILIIEISGGVSFHEGIITPLGSKNSLGQVYSPSIHHTDIFIIEISGGVSFHEGIFTPLGNKNSLGQLYPPAYTTQTS